MSVIMDSLIIIENSRNSDLNGRYQRYDKFQMIYQNIDSQNRVLAEIEFYENRWNIFCNGDREEIVAYCCVDDPSDVPYSGTELNQ